MSPAPASTSTTELRLIVAATGGVAAQKTPTLIRRLRQAGAQVRAAATDDAYGFVTPLALAVAAGSPVLDRERWFSASGSVEHVDWAAWADGLVVAPATADALAHAAHGEAGDVVSALIAAGVPRVVWAPAMNPAMWRHPPVRANVGSLESLGHAVVGPVRGTLAGADEGEGVGRLADVDAIVAAVLGLRHGRDLRGVRLLVTAGPTREYLDPVRFLSNPSSGRQGFAVAHAALARGARVTLVSGPSAEADPPGAEVIRVESAAQMLAAVEARFEESDALVMTAAVADWAPAQRSTRKEPKGPAEARRTLELERTPDILMALRERRKERVVIGFAMETHEGVERAARKARDKGCALMVLNFPAATPGVGFGADAVEATLVRPDGTREGLPCMPKGALAHELLTRLRSLLARSAASEGP